MAEFLAQNSMYVVLVVVLLVWLGIFAYLFRIDNKLRKLEKSIEQ